MNILTYRETLRPVSTHPCHGTNEPNTLKTLGRTEQCRANVLTYKETLRRLDSINRALNARELFRFLQGLTDFQDRMSPLLVNDSLKRVFKRSLKTSLWHISLWKAWTVFDWIRNLSLRRAISVLIGGAFEFDWYITFVVVVFRFSPNST